MLTESDELDDADRDASPAALTAEERRRRTRWMAMIFFGLGLVCLVAIYLFVLRRAQGDYVMNPLEVTVTRLWMTVVPRLTADVGPPGVPPTESIYVVGTSRIHLVPFESLTPVEGSPHLYRTSGRWGMFGLTELVERYPLDSTTRYVNALRSRGGGGAPDLVPAARELAERLPGRVTPKFWLIAALCHDGQTTEARTLLERWRGEIEAATEGRSGYFRHLLENDVAASEPAARQRSEAFLAHFPFVPSVPFDLDASLAWTAAFTPDDLPRHLTLEVRHPNATLVFLSTGLAVSRSLLMRVEGRAADAHRLDLGVYAITALARDFRHQMDFNPSLHTRATVTAMLLEVYGKGAWTAEELESAWRDWEALWAQLPAYDSEAVLRGVSPEIATLGDLRALLAPGGAGRAGTWMHRSSYVRLVRGEAQRELLRETMRARHALLATGEWPRVDADGALEGLLLDTDRPPLDPFATPPRPLRARVTTDTLTLWSVGPDGVDDKGLLAFDPPDPTSPAPGDIIVEVAREPAYRFPREPGYVYAGRADVDARYPGGLPRDPYAQRSKSPLGVAGDDSGYVWSIGPDTEERRHADRLQPGLPVEALYDPTNGVTSWGDVYVKLNFAD